MISANLFNLENACIYYVSADSNFVALNTRSQTLAKFGVKS